MTRFLFWLVWIRAQESEFLVLYRGQHPPDEFVGTAVVPAPDDVQVVFVILDRKASAFKYLPADKLKAYLQELEEFEGNL